MEKELQNYINLDNKLDRIADLIAKLKEDNRQLREANAQLLIQCQSAHSNKVKSSISEDNENDKLHVLETLTEAESETVRQFIKNALLKLEQLRSVVTEAN